MRNILVTGVTVFVSRYVAEYFAKKGDNVYVLNRNNRPQSEGVYYIFISSSAVYPETLPQPFCEEQQCGPNSIWGSYGTNKLEAEQYLTKYVPQAYILRPPYLYGPMQNVYREPFVFDCARTGRPFYIPRDGKMPLQFFHVEDLCRFIETLLEKKPENRVFNVGNPETVSIDEWVQMCYEVVGSKLEKIYVNDSHSQRDYFCFHDYAYQLDVSKQMELMSDVKPLIKGLKESYAWYCEHEELVRKKPLMEYIDKEIR